MKTSSLRSLTALLLLAGIAAGVCAQDAPVSPPLPGTSLFADATLDIPSHGKKGPKGTWAGGGTKDSFTWYKDDQGKTVCKIVAPTIQRLQYGADGYIKNIPAGTMLRASVWVRANITSKAPKSAGVVMTIELQGPNGAGDQFSIGPNMTQAKPGDKPENKPVTGVLPWTKVETTFKLPENTKAIKMLMYLMEAAGEVEWRQPELVVSDATVAAVNVKDRFISKEEGAVAAAAAWDGTFGNRMAKLAEKLGPLPDPSTLYSPGPLMTGPHPRFLMPSVPLAKLRERAAAPEYAKVLAAIREAADTTLATPPPTTVTLTSEDPLRGLAEQITPLAIAALTDPDLARRATYRTGLETWVRATLSWGVTPKNLPLSQQILVLSAVYDWFQGDLPADLLAEIRLGIIARVRGSLDAGNNEITMWRGTQFLANHNWFHHSALAMAACMLWNDTAAPLESGEQKRWLDTAVLNFWIVKKTHPKDGAALEGYLYQDYGIRPYMEFALIADQLLVAKDAFLDDEAIRALPVRLDSLLPNRSGFMVFSDSYPQQFGAAPWFRLLASRFKDGRAQLLADVLENAVETGKKSGSRLGWRTLFFYDPSVPNAKLEEQPLSRDLTDLGLYTARSSWDAPDATFFGLRCGPHAGLTATKNFGPGLTSGHGYPEQGSFSFYLGDKPFIPGTNYAKNKVTLNHSLVVFEGRAGQKAKRVGQVGEGGAWFGNYGGRLRDATTQRLTPETATGPHAYLCDLGGLYRLSDERIDTPAPVAPDAPASAAAPKGIFFPAYHRILVYFPEGAVVVVDRVQTTQPRNFDFRLLTAVKDLTGEGALFTGTLGKEKVKIVNFSAPALTASLGDESLPLWSGQERRVLSLAARESQSAVFAVALGRVAAVDGLRVQADEQKVVIQRKGQSPLTYTWDTPPSP
jgi:hypothetical protein